MNANARTLLGMSAAALLASCSTTPMEETRSPKAQEELDRALAGRVAGPPVNCIPSYRSTDMQIIDDYTILFKVGRITYVQNPRGGCQGIGNGSNTLVTKLIGTSQLCSGDINNLVDFHTRIGGGACVFSPFVPYTKPAS